jgi:hypothetical protein
MAIDRFFAEIPEGALNGVEGLKGNAAVSGKVHLL